SVLPRPLTRRLESALAEGEDRLRTAGMQQQQRREHPGVAVPEDMAGIAECQATRTGSPRRIRSRARQQIVELRMRDLLCPEISVDHDVGLPERTPGGALCARELMIEDRKSTRLNSSH